MKGINEVSNLKDELLCLLEHDLPIGWVTTSEVHNNIIVISGPSNAKITISSIRKGKLSVKGCWPNNNSGAIMDPYSWGVLEYHDNYPFIRLSTLKSPQSNIKSVLNYIKDYKSIYNECLSRCSLQIQA